MFSESIEHEGNKLLSYDIALYSSIHFEHPLQSLVDSFVGPSEPRCQYSSQLSWRIADSNSGSIVGRVEGLSQNKAKQNHRNVSWGDPTIWHNQPESLRYGWWKLKQTTIQEKDCTDQIWKGMQRMIYIYIYIHTWITSWKSDRAPVLGTYGMWIQIWQGSFHWPMLTSTCLLETVVLTIGLSSYIQYPRIGSSLLAFLNPLHFSGPRLHDRWLIPQSSVSMYIHIHIIMHMDNITPYCK